MALPSRMQVNINTETILNLTTPSQLFGSKLVSFYSPASVTMYSQTPYISAILNQGSDGASGNLSTISGSNRPLYIENDSSLNNQPSFSFAYNNIGTYNSSGTGIYNNTYNTIAGQDYTYFGVISAQSKYQFIAYDSAVNAGTYRSYLFKGSFFGGWTICGLGDDAQAFRFNNGMCWDQMPIFFMYRTGTASTNYIFLKNAFANNKAHITSYDLGSSYYRKGLIIGNYRGITLESVGRVGELGIAKNWIWSDDEFNTLYRYYQIKFGCA